MSATGGVVKAGGGVTICARMMAHSLTGLRRAGIAAEPILERAGIRPEDLGAPGARLPIDQVVKLHYLCMQRCRDEFIHLLHKPVPLGSYRLIALSVVHCHTLGQALQRYVEFLNIQQNSFTHRLLSRGEQVEFVMERIPDHSIACNYAIDSLLSIHHRFIGWLANERIIVHRVKLDFAAPDYRTEYPYMFYGAPVHFHQNSNSLSFSSAYLERPVVQNEAAVESYIRRAPLDVFLPLDAGGPVTRAIRKRLLDHFGTAEQVLTLGPICDLMNVHPQTLRRQLEAEHTSFSAIKGQVRRDIAIHYLGQDAISVEQVAEKSGYSESAAFIRAFKGWTGMTPLQFRKGVDISRAPH